MVQIRQKDIERLMPISQEIAREAGTDPAIARRVMQVMEERIIKNRRPNNPSPPKGSIGQSAAARKYSIAQTTINGWIEKEKNGNKRGYIPVLLRTRKEVFIDEAKLIAVIKVFKKSPGRGTKIVKRKFGFNPSMGDING